MPSPKVNPPNPADIQNQKVKAVIMEQKLDDSVIKTAQTSMKKDIKQELHRLVDSKANFYDMLNQRMTNDYKISEYDVNYQQGSDPNMAAGKASLTM